jgi:hypothetical protein
MSEIFISKHALRFCLQQFRGRKGVLAGLDFLNDWSDDRAGTGLRLNESLEFEPQIFLK